MKLIYEHTGVEVKTGDIVHLKNKPHFVESIQPPHKPASTGRIYLTTMRDPHDRHLTTGYFPGVVGAVWTGRVDQ